MPGAGSPLSGNQRRSCLNARAITAGTIAAVQVAAGLNLIGNQTISAPGSRSTHHETVVRNSQVVRTRVARPRTR